MKTSQWIFILGMAGFGTQAMAQTTKPVQISDQITMTSDYVGSISKNIEALGSTGGNSSHDYEIAAREFRDRVGSALKTFESSMKNMVLLPLGRSVDSYNSTLTQPNINSEVRKIQLESKMQVLVSAAASYEAVYHQLAKELYQVIPNLIVDHTEFASKSRKGRFFTLTFADASKSEPRQFDGQKEDLDPNGWALKNLATMGFKFRDENNNTGPFVSYEEDRDNGYNRPSGTQWIRASLAEVSRSVAGQGRRNEILSFLYPDYAYQAIFKACQNGARGGQPSQTCMTQLRGDYQEYYLEVRDILDRNISIALGDGKSVSLMGSKSDKKYGFFKLILPSLAGIEYPDNFSTFPVSN